MEDKEYFATWIDRDGMPSAGNLRLPPETEAADCIAYIEDAQGASHIIVTRLV